MRAGRAAFIGLAVAAVASSSYAADASAPPGESFSVDNPGNWGSPSRIVRPEYPKESLARGQTGCVDVDGVVAPLLNLDDVHYTPDAPNSAVFVDALREVMPDWQFHTPYTKDCWPSDQRISVRVWFDTKDGKPSIGVSRPVHPEWADKREKLVPLESVDPIYPKRMIESSREAVVYASVRIDRQGRVASVDTKAYQRKFAGGLGAFTHSVEEALSKWRFPPAREGDKDLRWHCYAVDFQLR